MPGREATRRPRLRRPNRGGIIALVAVVALLVLLTSLRGIALFYTDYSIGWLGLADGCWKYLYEIDSRRSRLFDVCADPGETIDRAAEHNNRVAAYRERVIAWAGAQKDLVARRATSERQALSR